MSRRTLALALALAAAPRAAAAQSPAPSLAARVAALPDGRAALQYATRPDACGDGRDVIGVRDALITGGSWMSMRGWTNAACAAGPARLVLTVTGGAVADLRVQVGPPRADSAGVRDLGTVAGADAAALALSLAGRLTGRPAQRAVAAAAVADGADVWRGLLALARSGADARTRQAALHWLGAVAPAEAAAPVAALAGDAAAPRPVREGALGALATIPDAAGVPALVAVARGEGQADAWLREKAVFWLGQADDARAGATLRALAASDTVVAGAREQAIFALGHGRGDAESAAFLRSLYRRLTSAQLRDRAIQGIAQADDAASRRWLLDLAADEGEPVEARKQALFWAGQQDDGPVAELLAVAPRLAGTELRKHYAFVLSQRDEDAAVDGLITLARRDADPAVRRQAIFWLGQSRSPRARQYLVEVLER